ncbi:MAG: 6-pyruvoyl-tetrahydropterin synthase-related protein [Candidatus Levybacteria bacterium]|nr:6-pyruvoyl-tetrahydropterin synthase-related protein [Candidatus Levybacteria bacterium]
MKIFKSKLVILFLLTILSIIPLLDLFRSGLPLTHDGQDHVARIANFYQNLREGNIIPRWAGNLNWGYGHPILEFLYPLPSYLASLFHFFGFTLVDSVKLVFGTSFVLSGLAMYIFIKELLNDDEAAFFASALYIIAPYRFVDLYVRGAIGEHVAFIFPPLIFYFLIKLSKNFSYWYTLGGSLSLAGLILSHNAITLMFLPLILICIFYLIFQCSHKKYFILSSLYLILLGFGLSAFFWIPAFTEGKYTLRDIVTGGGEYARSFVTWKDFFLSAWSYGGAITLSKQIGIIHWVSVFGSAIAAYHLYKKRNKLWIVCLGSILIFWVTLFLMTSSSNPIWQTITTLQKFQFPWRFLSVTVFLSALMGGILLSLISNKYKKVALIILVVGLLVANKDYWHANDYLQKEESFYSGIYDGTTDTGESAPIWSIRFMEKRPKAQLEVIDGDAKIKELDRKSTYHKYQVQVNKNTLFGENTLYFPGWEIKANGKPLNIEFQNMQYRGIMTFSLTKGSYLVEAEYKETKLRLISDIISFTVLFVAIFLLVFKFVKPKLS